MPYHPGHEDVASLVNGSAIECFPCARELHKVQLLLALQLRSVSSVLDQLSLTTNGPLSVIFSNLSIASVAPH